MKQLIFKLITNKEEKINSKLKYYKKDNTYFIKDNDSIYKIDVLKKSFIKETKESIIKIDIKNKIIIITLKENNLSVNMNLLSGNFKNEDNIINIEYTLDDGENTYNCINIEY